MSVEWFLLRRGKRRVSCVVGDFLLRQRLRDYY
jgi:hypothetical protein